MFESGSSHSGPEGPLELTIKRIERKLPKEKLFIRKTLLYLIISFFPFLLGYFFITFQEAVIFKKLRISLTKKCNLDTVACPYSHWLCWHGVDNSQLFRSHYMSVQHRLRRDRVGKVIDYVDAMSVWSLSLLCDHCQYRIHWFKIWQFEKYLAPLYVLNLQKTKFFFNFLNLLKLNQCCGPGSRSFAGIRSVPDHLAGSWSVLIRIFFAGSGSEKETPILRRLWPCISLLKDIF